MTFTDPAQVADYLQRTERIVPGLHDLHRMACLLMAERTPDNARVLVLGAGGGLELKAFATLQPGWQLLGIDPSAQMLDLARTLLGPLATRVTLHEGYIDSGDAGPFDAATCLLTLHFLPEAERLRTLRELHRRLKPGAPLVVAHHSFPNQGSEQDRWLLRNATFANAPGTAPKQLAESIATMKERLPVLTPEQDVALLEAAGFTDVQLFYCGLTFKGWVAYRS
ncbi:methyltransferase domain-containing protein [Pseudomonas entomophila]|uniref:class I SAM-dependent methyltransferase n=1 Tax=Pseudomonas entomophila TaxID=312306 RepID=UPI0023D891FC|nr:class I SAM-dependent methyltransferase [Pseudomonas entomophila]MDF0730423.1 methyltransferase domain-containing protein [Pseudomonas entomophila]